MFCAEAVRVTLKVVERRVEGRCAFCACARRYACCRHAALFALRRTQAVRAMSARKDEAAFTTPCLSATRLLCFALPAAHAARVRDVAILMPRHEPRGGVDVARSAV